MKWRTVHKNLVLAIFSIVVVLAGCPNEPVQDGPAGALLQPPPEGANGQQGWAQGGGPGAPQGPPPPAAGEDNLQPSEDTTGENTGSEDGTEGSSADAAGVVLEPVSPVPEGVPSSDEKKAPGMFVKLDALPPQILDQSTLSTSASAIKLTGRVSGPACKGKSVRLDALELRDGHPELMTAKTKRGIGPFELFVPKSETKVWITAFCDVDGDGIFEGGSDYAGAYGKNPIIPKANNLQNIAINLSQEVPSVKNGVLVTGDQ